MCHTTFCLPHSDSGAHCQFANPCSTEERFSNSHVETVSVAYASMILSENCLLKRLLRLLRNLLVSKRGILLQQFIQPALGFFFVYGVTITFGEDIKTRIIAMEAIVVLESIFKVIAVVIECSTSPFPSFFQAIQ